MDLKPLTLAVALTASLVAGPATASAGGPAPARAGFAVPGPTPAPTPAPSPLPQGAQPVSLNPADFTTRVDNPYRPLLPGSRWTYTSTGIDGDLRTEVTVAEPGRAVLGIDTVAVRALTTDAGGGTVRDSTGWYAQDSSGNVWYFGETTRDYIEGTLTDADGWETGRDGAQPGIAMPARPVPGQRWRVEYSPGRAEDQARVLTVGQRVSVPAGAYGDVVTVEETSRLYPGVRVQHSYAPGVGLVRSESPGGADRTSLVAFRRP